MNRIFLTLLLITLLIAVGLGWQVKTKADRITLLSERNDRLNGLVNTLNRANEDLAAQVQEMAERHRRTLTVAAEAEQEKRRIAAELDKTYADLRQALASNREWAETPVPAPVATGVNAALERLRDPAPGDHHQL